MAVALEFTHINVAASYPNGEGQTANIGYEGTMGPQAALEIHRNLWLRNKTGDYPGGVLCVGISDGLFAAFRTADQLDEAGQKAVRRRVQQEQLDAYHIESFVALLPTRMAIEMIEDGWMVTYFKGGKRMKRALFGYTPDGRLFDADKVMTMAMDEDG